VPSAEVKLLRDARRPGSALALSSGFAKPAAAKISGRLRLDRLTRSLRDIAFIVAHRGFQNAIVCLPIKARAWKLPEFEAHRRVIVIFVPPVEPLDFRLAYTQLDGQCTTSYVPTLWANIDAYATSGCVALPPTGEHLDLSAKPPRGHARLDPKSGDVVKPPSAHQAIERDTVHGEIKKGPRRLSAHVSLALRNLKHQPIVVHPEIMVCGSGRRTLARKSNENRFHVATDPTSFRRKKRWGIVVSRKLPMGIPDQPNRSKVLAWLAGFVVVFGVVAWLVTGGIRFQGAPLPLAHNHPATFPLPGSTPVVDCPSNELKVLGIYDECATAAPAKTSTCDVHGQMLDQVLRFTGDHQAFALEIQIDGTYAGPGTYDLPSWPRPLGTKPDVPKVAMFATGVFWQSISGILTVTGTDGRSGWMVAILQTSNGTTVMPGGPTLNISGSWRCP
jgi:hypothetical protein